MYDLLRLYTNYFQPVRKRYDKAQTPYRRLVTSGVLSADQAHQLELAYRRLIPLTLQAEPDRKLEMLWRLAQRPAPVVPVKAR